MNQSYIVSCEAVNILRCLTGNNYRRNYYWMKLSERIKKARQHAKLTQEQLSSKSGVAQQVISKLENGKQLETAGIVKIARACKVSADWLEDETGPMLLPVSTGYGQPEYIRNVIETMRVMEPTEQYLAARLIETIANPIPVAQEITAAAQPEPIPLASENPPHPRPASSVSGGPPKQQKKHIARKKIL